MNCSERDADLLMLVHGELDRGRALRVRTHVLFCPVCRARLRRFETLAGTLATTLRNPVLGVRALGSAPTRAWASVGLLATLLTLLGWLVASNAVAARTPPPPPTVVCPAHFCHFTPTKTKLFRQTLSFPSATHLVGSANALPTCPEQKIP